MVENKDLTNLTKTQIQKYRLIFGLIDQDGDDLISFEDIKSAFHDIGITMDENTIKDDMLSTGKDGKLDFNGFLNVVGSKFGGFSEESELRDAFETFKSNNHIDSNLLKQNILNVVDDNQIKEGITDAIDEYTNENKITGEKKFEQDRFIANIKQ